MRLKCLKAGGYTRNVEPEPINVAEGEEFEVSDDLGKELLQSFAHARWFEKIGGKPKVAEPEASEADVESPRRGGKPR